MIAASEAVCVCCGRARGFIYKTAPYAEEDLESCLCPWCIADGSAAAKFNADFVDATALVKAGVPPEIIDEVRSRTPGYISWQQEEWLSHCGDACEFHGDATAEEIVKVAETTKSLWRSHYGLTDDDWTAIKKTYAPGASPAFYKFVCRHCGQVLLGWDCD
jgi:hypothetical protein